MILLVAITVVLAAVLYILISGLTKGPSATPLGSAFAWGRITNVTGPAEVGCTIPTECYNLEIGATGHQLKGSSLTFSVRSSTGSIPSFSTWTFTLVGTSGAAAGATWTGSGACAGSGCSAALGAGEIIVLDTGSTASLQGDSLLALGVGNFQGEVASPALPR
jgi:FlaG/FlaF family flagellin (archaellin)